jgi:hypothetical protein
MEDASKVCTERDYWFYYCITVRKGTILFDSIKDRRCDAIAWAEDEFQMTWAQLRKDGYRVRRLRAHMDD